MRCEPTCCPASPFPGWHPSQTHLQLIAAFALDHCSKTQIRLAQTVVFRLDFSLTTAGGYRVRVNARNNGSTWTNSAWVNVTDAPHIIEPDWQSGTSGSLAWWIDEAHHSSLPAEANSFLT